MMASNDTFVIHSRKYGDFVVTVPSELAEVISITTWHVNKKYKMAAGRDFYVVGWMKNDGGKFQCVPLSVYVWKLLGRTPVAKIDHIDGQPLNNSRDNLRDGSLRNSQNLRTRPLRNTSGCVGVTWHKKSGKWQAYVTSFRKYKYLGLFSSLDEAIAARDTAARTLHADFFVPSVRPKSPEVTR